MLPAIYGNPFFPIFFISKQEMFIFKSAFMLLLVLLSTALALIKLFARLTVYLLHWRRLREIRAAPVFSYLFPCRSFSLLGSVLSTDKRPLLLTMMSSLLALLLPKSQVHHPAIVIASENSIFHKLSRMQPFLIPQTKQSRNTLPKYPRKYG